MDTQRYTVLLKADDTRQVKPQNLRFVGNFSLKMVNKYQLDSFLADAKPTLASAVASLTRSQCVRPNVVSARVMNDWAKLDDMQLADKLIHAKQVSASTLSEDVAVLYVSVPRKQVVCGSISEVPAEELGMLRKFFLQFGKFIENELKKQVYYILPWNI